MACHDAHGSNGPKLMNEKTIADMCQSCHTDLSKHFHKTSSERLDPDGRPLTCTSCHLPHAGELDGLLKADPKRDLCIRCHDPNIVPGGHTPASDDNTPAPTTPAPGGGKK